MDKRDTERVIRIAITDAGAASNRVETIQESMRFKEQHGADDLAQARVDLNKADKNIRRWAKANGYEVTESMQT